MEEGREPSISEERESQEKGTANTKAYPWPDGPASRKPVWMEDTARGSSSYQERILEAHGVCVLS